MKRYTIAETIRRHKQRRKREIAMEFARVRSAWTLGNALAGIDSRVDDYVSAGYTVIMPNGHGIDTDERRARAVVDAELPS